MDSIKIAILIFAPQFVPRRMVALRNCSNGCGDEQIVKNSPLSLTSLTLGQCFGLESYDGLPRSGVMTERDDDGYAN